MKLRLKTLTIFFISGLVLGSPAFLQAHSSCLTTQEIDGFVCPPPGGDLVRDMYNRAICGKGQCVIDSNGKVKCSSLFGGGAVIDSRGEALCVGGCEEGRAAFCVRPQ